MGMDTFGLNENERLWDKITIDRLIIIIRNQPDVYVSNISRGTNNYGEFLFITLQNDKKQDAVFFYTFGWHELLGKYLVDFAKIGLGNYDKEQKHMKKSDAVRKIMDEKRKALKNSKTFKGDGDDRDVTDMEVEELEEIGFI